MHRFVSTLSLLGCLSIGAALYAADRPKEVIIEKSGVQSRLLSRAEIKKLMKERNRLSSDLSAIKNFTLTRSDGTERKLADFATGQPTVIALWASFCAPCRAEAKQLIDMQARFPKNALTILYINPIIGDMAKPEGKAFLDATGARVLDPMQMQTFDAMKLVRSNKVSMPKVMFYDRSGKARAVVEGGDVTINGVPQNAPRWNGDKRIVAALAKIIDIRNVK